MPTLHFSWAWCYFSFSSNLWTVVYLRIQNVHPLVCLVSQSWKPVHRFQNQISLIDLSSLLTNIVHCKCKSQKVNSYKLTCTNILLYTEQHTHTKMHRCAHTPIILQYYNTLQWAALTIWAVNTYNSIVVKQRKQTTTDYWAVFLFS